MFWKRLGEFFLDLLEVIVFAVAIFLFVYTLLMQPHKIKGASMEPNYHDGEFIITDKLTYRFREPMRGEVIVFEAPGENGEEYIKRIIGLPGETVLVKDNSVYINNKKLIEVYIPAGVGTSEINFASDSPVTIESDKYFVLGDNRPQSSDSRRWGLVDKPSITGRAWFIYWPLDKSGLIKEVEYAF